MSGNQAKKIVFNGSHSEYFGPQSAGEPASAFEGSTGVVAGTVLRRLNGNGGGRRWGPGVQSSSGAVSLKEVSGVHPGETDSGVFFCCGMETDSCGAQFVFPVAETESGGVQFEYSAAETDAGGAQCVHGAGPSRYDPKCGQREGAEVLLSLSLDAGDAQRVCRFWRCWSRTT